MKRETIVRIAAGMGFVGVGLGAFGAHGLADLLERNGRVGTWETAVLYHLVHAVALLAVGALARPSRMVAGAFLAGVVLFSGSLYLLSVTNLTWLGAITPLGGLAFLAGWAGLGASSLRA